MWFNETRTYYIRDNIQWELIEPEDIHAEIKRQTKILDAHYEAEYLKGIIKSIDHISDIEIAKYMIAVAYLEKDELSNDQNIGVHPFIDSFQVFIEEMILTLGAPKKEYTDQLK